MNMTWEEKFLALKAIDENISIQCRKPGDWFVMDHMEIGGDGMLLSINSDGTSPADAIECLWESVVKIKPPLYIAVRSEGTRRQYRWNYFMWKEVPLNRKAESHD